MLTYALIYQSRMQSGEVLMSDFMRDIKPKASIEVSALTRQTL
ncbi:hypothetical protein [Bathymodiolus platifrons methanotrophic gill symbiont]|nr:hypothetical protein [Bathymodiolus platifrons methanotrophic gill symbiont]